MVQPSEQASKQTGKKTKPGRGGKRVSGQRSLKGQEERKLETIRRCWGYKKQGWELRDIGIKVAEEMGYATPIHFTTVSQYITAGKVYETRKVAEHRADFIDESLPQLNMAIKEWLPRAVGLRRIGVARMEKVNGELLEIIDANAHKEQYDALKGLISVVEQKRKILGVGLATAGEEADGKAATLTQINILLQQTINQNGAAPGAQIGQTPLTLEAGDAAFEEL